MIPKEMLKALETHHGLGTSRSRSALAANCHAKKPARPAAFDQRSMRTQGAMMLQKRDGGAA
jgi:hypothetical protein